MEGIGVVQNHRYRLAPMTAEAAPVPHFPGWAISINVRMPVQ